MLTPKEKLELIYVICQNDFKKADELFSKDPNLLSSLNSYAPIDKRILSLVCMAIEWGSKELLDLMIIHYPGVLNITDSNGFTPLIWACYHNKLSIVTYLLDKYPNINVNQLVGSQSRQFEGYTALHIAVKKQYQQIAELLIVNNADQTMTTPSGLGLVHLAAEAGYVRIVEKLINANPELLQQKTHKDASVLMLAVAFGSRRFVNYIITKYRELTIQLPETNRLLSLALKGKHINLFVFLVEELMPTTCIDSHIADEAVKQNLSDVVQFCIEHNETIDENNPLWKAVIISAVQINDPTLIFRLVEGKKNHLHQKYNEKDESCSIAKTILWVAIEKGPDIILDYLNPRVIKYLQENELDLVYFAAKHGRLSTLKALVNAHPELINQRDAKGNLLLHWAASYRQYAVTEYLLTHNSIELDLDVPNSTHLNERSYASCPEPRASVSAYVSNLVHSVMKSRVGIESLDFIDKPGDVGRLGFLGYCGKAQSYHLLEYLIELNEWDICNLIIKKCLDFGKIEYLNYIRDGQQAAEFMVSYLDYQPMLKQNLRIKNLLLNKSTTDEQSDKIYVYKASRERSPSFFCIMDINKETTELFKPVRKLGQGSYGSVRMFSSESEELIAVKSALNDSSRKDRPLSHLIAQGRQEADMINKAYPNQKISYFKQIIHRKNNETIYSDRLIMDYHEAKALADFNHGIKSPSLLAQTMLRVIKELDLLHQKNIVHGDMNLGNIMVNCLGQVYFIDFGFSKDASAPIPPGQPAFYYSAPELHKNQEGLLANPNQDIFSLGYWLQDIILNHSSGYKLSNQYPSLVDFSNKALEENPERRPQLKDFIEKLSDEINQPMPVNRTKLG